MLALRGQLVARVCDEGASARGQLALRFSQRSKNPRKKFAFVEDPRDEIALATSCPREAFRPRVYTTSFPAVFATTSSNVTSGANSTK